MTDIKIQDPSDIMDAARFHVWRSFRKWDMDIMYDETNNLIQRGFTYPDGAWIVLLPQYGGIWHCHVETSECESQDLELVEQFLWNEFSISNYDEEVDGVS